MVQLTMQAIPDRVVHGIWYMAFILADGECLLDACPPEFSHVLPEVHDNRYPIPPLEIVRSRWMQTMTAEQKIAPPNVAQNPQGSPLQAAPRQSMAVDGAAIAEPPEAIEAWNRGDYATAYHNGNREINRVFREPSLSQRLRRPFNEQIQWLADKFPTQRNREVQMDIREHFSEGNYRRRGKRPFLARLFAPIADAICSHR